MNRPNAEIPAPNDPGPAGNLPAPPAGGLDPTLAATGVFAPASDAAAAGATVEPTLAFTPTQAPDAADDATVEVTNLAFPRAHVGPDPGATVETAPSIPPRRAPRLRPDSETRPTLDAEGNTNPFSLSSLDGSAEVVLNDLPFVEGYKLLSELGRGGMGVVYKARQKKLDRFVALKMVLAGAHASADQLERFMVEAQAVAHLTHNHIVRIYDVGERDNLPFFSLEFIDGGSLQQAMDGKPQPVLYAAKIVRTLCEAIAFAHDRGIIHRDLKPANVLMTVAGEPKITDFGLAKRLEGNSQQTRDGAIMGTPSYMAPEQAWGRTQEIGPLADEHALGAILYEMLTGRPPYQGANPLDTLDQVRNQEPVPPSRLQPKVPRDLETICLKALQKDPKKRYASCQEMADDLGRFLDDKPIVARPVSAAERTVRWCKRNKAQAVAIGAVASLLVLAAGGGSAAAVIFKNQKDALAIAKKQETDAKDRAIAREKETRALALSAIDQTNTMLEAQRYLSVLANQMLRDIPNTIPVRREMFNVALKSMERAQKDIDNLRKQGAGAAATDALTLRTMAGIHQNRGMIYSEMPSKAALVWPEFDAMKRLAEQHYAMDPNDLEAIKNMAAARLTLGESTLRLKGDVAAAERFLLEAIDFRNKWLERQPDDVAKQGLCNGLGALAGLYQATGRPRLALPLYLRELQIREAIGPARAADTEFHREFSGLHQKLGDLYVRLEDFRKAREHYSISLGRRRDFANRYPDHAEALRDVSLSLQKRGNFYEIIEKDLRSARKDYEAAADVYRQRLKLDSTSMVKRNDLALILYFLGTVDLQLKDIAASDAAYAESLQLCKELVAGSGPMGDANRVAYMDLMLRMARCGDHAGATKIAAELVKTPPNNALIYFQAACGYALSAAAVERHSPDDVTLAKSYRDTASSLLRKALARGWHSVQDIAGDPDLEPLRSDPAFPALLDEFRKADDADKAKAQKKA